MEKRKREDDGGRSAPRPREEDAVKDEEVEEFFAILKRIQVAVKYFQERRCPESAAPRWSPTFQPEDFEGVKMESEGTPTLSAALDLNSDPPSHL